MPDCTNCPYAGQIQQIKEDVAALRSELAATRKDKSDAHHEIYDRLNALELQTASWNTERKYIIDQLKDIKSDLKEVRDLIQERQKLPEKRWDVAVAAVISGTITLILAWLSNKLSGGV